MISDTIKQLTSKWWTFLVRGLVTLALAAFAFSAPAATASALVYVFAAYFIISGVVSLLAGISFTGVGHWWALILMGFVQGALGFVMLAQPGIGPLALAYFFAIWMISTGLMEISGAVALRSYVSNEFWWILLGIITLAFGFYVVMRPDLGLLALVYTIGFYAVLAGVSLIAFSFRIKSAGADFAKIHAPA
ncbi:MAG: HdeD family acid-resistance protein [Vulcanimicrobiaceae bacterium]